MTGPVETYNPNDERFEALVQSFVWTLTASLGAGMLATGISVNDHPYGFVLLLAAFTVGTYPLGRWKHRSLKDSRLSVAEFPAELASLMAIASANNRCLHILARRAKPGPVQDHLLVLAATADHEIRNAYESFKTSMSEHIFVELAVENSSLLEDLSELERAAGSLLDTQQRFFDFEAR